MEIYHSSNSKFFLPCQMKKIGLYYKDDEVCDEGRDLGSWTRMIGGLF